MKIEIAWKTFDNVQTKNFKDETAAMEWIRKNCENIVSINDTPTYGEVLSHFEIMDCLKGNPISISTTPQHRADAIGASNRFSRR